MSYLRYTIHKRKGFIPYFVLTHETVGWSGTAHVSYLSDDMRDIITTCNKLHMMGNYKRVKKL